VQKPFENGQELERGFSAVTRFSNDLTGERQEKNGKVPI